MSYSFFSTRLVLPQNLILFSTVNFPEKVNVENLYTVYESDGLEFDEYGNPSVTEVNTKE